MRWRPFRPWCAVWLALTCAGAAPAALAAAAPPPALATRAQFAALLVRAGGVGAQPGPPFADVPPSAAYFRAVEAAAGLGWMAAATPDRFLPGAPADRAMAAAAAADYLGLDHVAADETGAPLPYSDAAAIPKGVRGAVAVASHLGLFGWVHGPFAASAPLTLAQARSFVRALAAVRPSRLEAEGARVAAYVHVFADANDVETGHTVAFDAYAHDAAGYVVPATFRWAATRGRIASSGALADEGRAVLRAGAIGWIGVTVTVAGGAVSASSGVEVLQAARLAVSAPPPAVLSTARLPLPVSLRTAFGGVDGGADGVTVAAVATPARGGAARTAVAQLSQGVGTITLPALPAGRYRLRVHVPGRPGLGTYTVPLLSVDAPVGGIALSVAGAPAGGAAAVRAGGRLTVEGAVYALSGVNGFSGLSRTLPAGPWPLQVATTGLSAALPYLTGESAPPATLTVHVASANMMTQGGAVAIIGGAAPGAGTVDVSVPGGALAPAELPVQVTPDGAFGAPRAAATGRAGATATLSVGLLPAGGTAAPTAVYLEPIDPDGHPRPYVAAVVRGDTATAALPPIEAGTWTFRWHAAGYPAAAGGSLRVAPGPAVRLVVDATPTSVLLPGQTVAIRAWLADRYGNPTRGQFVLARAMSSATGAAAPAPAGSDGIAQAVAATAGGQAAAPPPGSGAAIGTLDFASGLFTSPSVVGSFTAAARLPQVAAGPAPRPAATAAGPVRQAPVVPAIEGGGAGVVPAVGGATPGQAVAGTVGTTAAGAAGAGPQAALETLAFTIPGRPSLGTARLVLRLVGRPAARIAGKGEWLTFPDWRDVPDAQLLAQAQAEGITHIYLEVATTLDGFYGGRALDDFLDKAHDDGIAVLAWVYAGLEDPAADTRLVQQVARYVTPRGDRIDGLALDLEEVLDPRTVAAYAAAADAAAGPGGLVVGVTYPPQYRMTYPFAALAPYVQAFAPMDYWHIFEADYSYAEVDRWVAESVALVRRLSRRPGLPVEVIAQTFDEFNSTGTGLFSPTGAEVAGAIAGARAAGAIGVSFYRPTTATPGELGAVAQSTWGVG